MPFAALADLIHHGLELTYPPIALARVDARPEGIDAIEETVPSACTFWRRAEEGVFYASSEGHANCPIGAMVMGFDLSGPQQETLMSLVGEMCALSYIREEEIPHIPRFDRASAGIVYGPLERFPLQPEIAIAWTLPAQAMLLQEALGGARWADTPQSGVFGRPACGALPKALSDGKATLSLGCMGMRTFTRIPEEISLFVIPGAALPELQAHLPATLEANCKMKAFYESRQVGS